MQYSKFAAITPSDSVNIPIVPRGIYVGGAGDISLYSMDDLAFATPILLKAVPVGTILPIRTKRIRATATTATLLIALY